MNLFQACSMAFLLILGSACGDDTKKASQLFDIQFEGGAKSFKVDATAKMELINKKDLNLSAVSFFIDGKKIENKDGSLVFDVEKLGNKILIAEISHDGVITKLEKKIKIFAANPPVVYTYEILNEYPHDKKAYTQGLEFVGDTLYESTGRKGQSSLRKLNYKTGEVLKKVDLDASYFGEGITILNNNIYQLTWQKGVGFVYDINTFNKKTTFKYNKSKEGWGLCNDGISIYKSDGSEKIWKLNPDTLIEEDFIELATHKSLYKQTNELEYVNGKIYANVYQKESVMIIDAKSGAILGVVNFGGLKKKVTQHKDLDVLNGIAYHKERKTFFVTGKNWDKMFEVNISKK